MRPRQHDLDLPQRTYYRHGRYWHVQGGKWQKLSSDPATALAEARAINEGLPVVEAYGGAQVVKVKILRMFDMAKRNAKSRGLAFELTFEDVLSMAARSNWQCALTGVPFTMKPVPGAKRRPFAPSLDRKDCSLGYTKENVRLVCCAANIALGDWGDEVFSKLALGYAQKRGFIGQSNTSTDK